MFERISWLTSGPLNQPAHLPTTLLKPEAGRSLVINGRFLSQPVTGVQRFSQHLIMAIDDLLASTGNFGRFAEVSLFSCRGARLMPLQAIRQEVIGRCSGNLWEQTELPWAARNAFLLNLGNTGPLRHRHQFITIHDAAVSAYPANYSPQFRAWYYFLHRLHGSTAQHIFTVSKFSATELSRYYGIEPQRISVIFNGADHFAQVIPTSDVLTRHGLKPGEYIFAIGSRTRIKNIEAAWRAISRLPKPWPTLVIAGHSDSRIFAAALGLEDTLVRMVGTVSDGEVKALYQNALCLIFPSLYEGFGLPPLEAMLCGCPVVVSRAAAMPEVCGNAALYAEPGDFDALAAQIQRLRRDPAFRSVMIDRGLAHVRAYSWAATASRLANFFLNLEVV